MDQNIVPRYFGSTGPTVRPDKSTLNSIQYLRAGAAAAVLGLHSGISHSHLGGSGVDLFFIISGFIMALVCRRESTPLAFASARFCRILPIYWLVTLVAAVGDGAAWHDVAVSLLLWPSQDPIVSQGWTLQIEVFFYFVVTVALWLSPGRMKTIVSLALGSLVLAGWIAQPALPVLRAYSHPLMLEFMAGLWLHEFWFRDILPSRAQAWGLLAAVAAYFALNYQAPLPSMSVRVVTWGVPHALLVWAALGLERKGSLPRIPLLRFLGDTSYSLYLVHQFALVWLKPRLWHLPGPAVIGIELLGSEALAAAIYFAAERPLVRVARWATGWLGERHLTRSTRRQLPDVSTTPAPRHSP